MAFQKFKPEVWSQKFMEDLDKTLVFKEDCNHTYEGDAKKPGDAVRIFGLGDVNIGAWHHGKLEQLATAQEVTGHSILMPINEIRTFNFEVGDDLDKAQAMGGSGLMGKFTTKAKDNVADVIDQFIAGLHVGNCEAANVSGGVPTAVAIDSNPQNASATYILDAIDNAYLKLLENNVSRNTKVTLTAPPWFIMMLKRAYVELDTDNSAMLANGRVGRYGGITLKESNNVYTATESGHSVAHIQLKTDEAIAFVNPYTHMEGYRPDLTFIDCVKGYTLFDGMVVAPKQVIDLNVYKYTA